MAEPHVAEPSPLDRHYLAHELSRELQTNPRVFEFLRENILNGLWYWDLEAPDNVWIDDRFWETLGHDPATKPDRSETWQSLADPKDLITLEQRLQRLVSDPEPPFDQVVRYRHADGSTVSLRCHGLALRNHEGKPTRLLAVHTEVAPLARTHVELPNGYRTLARTAEARASELRQLIEGLPALVWTCRPDGPCDYLSAQWVEYTGIPESEQLGSGWLQALHPEDVPTITSAWAQSVERGQPMNIEFRIRRHDGEYRWFKTRANALRDETGEVTKWFGINIDVHDQKVLEASLSERSAALERSNTELERFAYVISHDLRAPLRGMKLAVGWLRAELGDTLSPEAKENLGLIESRSERLSALIDGVLLYSRAQRNPLTPERFALEPVVHEIIEDLSAGARCKIIPEGPWPHFRADRVQIAQVLRNLVDNALKFHDRPDGTVRIRATTTPLYHRISVIDDGPGIPPQQRERVFGLFATLNPERQQENTGVGLALCKAIVERWGGQIGIDGTEPRGTTVWFTIEREPA